MDLTLIEQLISRYDDRMNIVRQYFDKREPIPEEYSEYLEVLKYDDAVQAFESLRPLIARIHELETKENSNA